MGLSILLSHGLLFFFGVYVLMLNDTCNLFRIVIDTLSHSHFIMTCRNFVNNQHIYSEFVWHSVSHIINPLADFIDTLISFGSFLYLLNYWAFIWVSSFGILTYQGYRVYPLYVSSSSHFYFYFV